MNFCKSSPYLLIFMTQQCAINLTHVPIKTIWSTITIRVCHFKLFSARSKEIAIYLQIDFFTFWFNCAIHNSLSFLNSLFLCTLQQEETNGYDITPEFFFIINYEILLIQLLLYNVRIPLSPHSPGLYCPIRENVRHG